MKFCINRVECWQVAEQYGAIDTVDAKPKKIAKKDVPPQLKPRKTRTELPPRLPPRKYVVRSAD